jgi:RimJ/RimL family protein N-acetyltransferase
MAELLRTPRLLLRDWEPGDVEAFFSIYSRWSVMKWLGAPPRKALATLDDAATSLERWRSVNAGVEPPYGLWAVQLLAAERPVGTVLLLPLSDDAGPTDEVEIGWHLHPDAEGHGFATEAAQALLARAALPRVLALTDEDNAPSQSVARRLGLVDEGLTGRWFGHTTRQFATERTRS